MLWHQRTRVRWRSAITSCRLCARMALSKTSRIRTARFGSWCLSARLGSSFTGRRSTRSRLARPRLQGIATLSKLSTRVRTCRMGSRSGPVAQTCSAYSGLIRGWLKFFDSRVAAGRRPLGCYRWCASCAAAILYGRPHVRFRSGAPGKGSMARALPWTRQGRSPWNQPVDVCSIGLSSLHPMTLRAP
jgi:hypothetical protein